MRRFPLLVLAATFALSACDSDGGGGSNGLDPADADALTQALTIAGATRIDGNAPAPSSASNAPSIDNGAARLVVGPGGTATVSFSVDSANDLAGFFLQITGAGAYIDAPLAQFTDGIGTFQFDLPSGTDEGDFELNYCVYTDDDDDGEPDLISNVISTGIDVDDAAGDGGSFGLGTSSVSLQGGGGFAGSAYSYSIGNQLVVVMVDGTLDEYGEDETRAFYFALDNVDGAGTYSFDGSGEPGGSNLAYYLDYTDEQNVDFLIATSGTVRLTSFGDRVAGTFDVDGIDFLSGGTSTRSITGSFEAVRDVGEVPEEPVRDAPAAD